MLDGRPKRTIMIKISVVGQDVRSEQVGFNAEMLGLDKKFAPDLGKARGMVKDPKEAKPGDRIHAPGYVDEPEYPHPGIHLFFNRRDEIVWFSEQPINFTVDIQRDPELILIGEAPSDVTPNNGIDNPFEQGTFPLESMTGEPVSSGPLRGRGGDDPFLKAVLDQRYYKYSVRVTGIKNALDPHVEGHFGD